MSPPRLLLIDNYDSFTYNLVQAFMILGAEVLVHRNDALTVEAAVALAPTHLCISPGPGTPREAGVSMRMIEAFAGRVPVLGVCLGHQSMVEVWGGEVVRAGRLMHGKVSLVEHEGVLALGGGAVLSERTREALQPHRVLYLEVGLTAAVQRVGLGTGRPLLLGNIRATLKRLLDERAPLYREVADITIKTDGVEPAAVADQVIDALRRRDG
jgi:anthranilate synthase/aminodeoxychorismate synthase-like glutamine amidotransferase